MTSDRQTDRDPRYPRPLPDWLVGELMLVLVAAGLGTAAVSLFYDWNTMQAFAVYSVSVTGVLAIEGILYAGKKVMSHAR